MSNTITWTLGPPLIFDSFYKAESASSLGTAETGQAWSNAIGTMGIQNFTAYCQTPDANSFGMAVVDSGKADVAVTAQVTRVQGPTGSANQWEGVICRYTDASNWIGIAAEGGGGGPLVLMKCVAGTKSRTALTSSFSGAHAPYTLRIECVGSAYTVKYNGTTYVTFTDTTCQTATKQGLAFEQFGSDQSTSTVFSSFSVEAL